MKSLTSFCLLSVLASRISPFAAAFVIGAAGGVGPQTSKWATSTAWKKDATTMLVRSARTTQLSMGFQDPAFFRRPKTAIVVDDQSKEVVEGTDGTFTQLGSFEVEGQGAVGFKFALDDDVTEVKFRFDPAKCQDDEAHPILHTISNEKGWIVEDVVTHEILACAPDDRGLPILNPGRNESFWMSFDKENMILRGGTGYMLTALELVNVAFADTQEKVSDEKIRNTYLINYGKLSRYSMYKPESVIKKNFCNDPEVELTTSKYPIYMDLPAIIKDHDDITLENIDDRNAITIKELSPECQRLYENVAGANIKVNTPDFPDFAEAIDYSIHYGICKEVLANKAKREFSTGSDEYDANQTYLRITLGRNMGNSPGIPYVMEIWPPGCYSPIHDHAETNAIIKVLHGSLTARFFESLDRAQQQQDCRSKVNQAKPYDHVVCTEGAVTWLDSRQFQTHQLFNHNIMGTACITIQCYMYNDKDDNHYENFDYIGDDGNIYPFVPNSDWDYGEFKKIIFNEFKDYKDVATPKPNIMKRSSD